MWNVTASRSAVTGRMCRGLIESGELKNRSETFLRCTRSSSLIQDMQRRRAAGLGLTGIKGKMRERNFDAAAIELLLHAQQKSAPYCPLLERLHLESTADHYCRVGPGIDTGDVDVLQNHWAERFILTHAGRDFAHYLKHFLDVLAVGDADVDHRVGKAAAAVGNGSDDAVGDKMYVALVVAQADIAQRNFFHQTALAGHFHHVTLTNLVFQQQKETVEIILDQTLRAEADGDTDHTGGCQNGGNGDAEFGKHQHPGNQRNQHGGDIAEDATQDRKSTRLNSSHSSIS